MGEEPMGAKPRSEHQRYVTKNQKDLFPRQKKEKKKRKRKRKKVKKKRENEPMFMRET